MDTQHIQPRARILASCAPATVMRALALLVVCVGLLWPAPSQAHPFAASSFEAETDASGVQFRFRIDALALLELFDAHAPEQKPASKEALAEGRDTILGYLDEKFGLTSGEGEGASPCTREAPTRLQFSKRFDKLQLDVRYECGAPLEVVQIRSGLFVDEESPHQIIGTFRHIRATERYFFTGGEREATIHLDRLRQGNVLPTFDTEGGVRLARPPPGAFAGPGRKAAPPKRTEGVGPASEPEPAEAELEPEPAEADAEPEQAEAAGFFAFSKMGVVHIFGGFDHILFVLTLLLVVRDWRELGIVVTSFTIAHSLTLAAVALELIMVSPRLVEPAIAATIIFVAVENVVRTEPEARPGLTFGFGLIHGLGFGGALAELGMGGGELVAPLLGFNVGVELGQLAIVLPLFPLVLWARGEGRESIYTRVRIGAGVIVALLGLWWLVTRLVG